MDKQEYHRMIFEDHISAVLKADTKEKEAGCTCGWNTATMTNAGTDYVEYSVEWGQFDEYCTIHGTVQDARN